MEEKQSYYIVIPTIIFEDENISSSCKILYGLISSLINKDGYCYAGNDYLASKINTTPENVSRLLKSLREREYVEVEHVSDGAIVRNRKIYISSRLTKMLNTVNKNVNRTVNKNVKESNKVISNKYIKEIYKEKYFENEELNDMFIEFLKIREIKKAVNNSSTIKKIITKLNKHDHETKKEMLERSIIGSWKDVYELRKEHKTNVPSWFNQEIKQNEMSEEEQEELRRGLERN